MDDHGALRPEDGGPPDGGGRRCLVPPVTALTVALGVSVVLGMSACQRPDDRVATPPTAPAAATASAAATATASASASGGRSEPADRPVRTRPEPGDRSAEQSVPTWISIDAGGVDGPLVPQGLSSDGTINPGRNEIVWFTGGDRVAPGRTGTAVVAAHVTWEGAPDAFVRLPEVGVGDVVTLGFGDGSTRTFTVTETAAVDKEALARSLTVWGPHPRVPRLAIITCDPALGFGADGHTEANFVVIAEG